MFAGYEDVYNITVDELHTVAIHLKEDVQKKNKLPILSGIVTFQCGEQPLLPFESCNLGSIDVSKMVEGKKFNWDRLEEVVSIAVRFLDDVIDVNKYPNIKIARKTRLTRKIGLGIMGWADALIMMGIKYDSQKAIKLATRLMMNIREVAHITSRELGKEKGYCFEKLKRRNATLTTIAPTGCQTKDNIIKAETESISVRQILERSGIDYNQIEKQGIKKWFNIPRLNLEILGGLGVSDKVYYNGLERVKRITFEDGNSYEFTYNHPLLVNRDGNEIWISVSELKEGDDIVAI